MATDPLANVRTRSGLRVAEIRDAGPRLSPLDLHARMDAIRQLAVGQRPRRARRARPLLGAAGAAARAPGRDASCLEHVDEALDSRSDARLPAILAALAVRLH